ncbi:Uncharacterised protein [Achromobacter xylosoxidans]|nr:Uncharacterised protein [Achromobacter xylosoxidans]CUR70313.1 hypothetical protein BN2877_57600 [Achromobacter xylosoxidans]
MLKVLIKNVRSFWWFYAILFVPLGIVVGW